MPYNLVEDESKTSSHIQNRIIFRFFLYTICRKTFIPISLSASCKSVNREGLCALQRESGISQLMTVFQQKQRFSRSSDTDRYCIYFCLISKNRGYVSTNVFFCSKNKISCLHWQSNCSTNYYYNLLLLIYQDISNINYVVTSNDYIIRGNF